MHTDKFRQSAPTRPKYEEFGITIEELGDTTHVFKEGEHIGSFSIDLSTKTLKFQFPDNEIFNYCAYIAGDLVTNRIQWVNESLTNMAMSQIQAGVAFLGFAKFEELMAYELDGKRTESIH